MALFLPDELDDPYIVAVVTAAQRELAQAMSPGPNQWGQQKSATAAEIRLVEERLQRQIDKAVADRDAALVAEKKRKARECKQTDPKRLAEENARRRAEHAEQTLSPAQERRLDAEMVEVATASWRAKWPPTSIPGGIRDLLADDRPVSLEEQEAARLRQQREEMEKWAWR